MKLGRVAILGWITVLGCFFLLAVRQQRLQREVNEMREATVTAVCGERPVSPAESKGGVAAEGVVDTEEFSQTHRVALWRNVQEITKDAVVQVFSSIAQFNWLEPYKTPQQFLAAGTGFFINQEGELLTNAHVVDQAKMVSIQIPSRGKRRFECNVLGVSVERDIALLKLTSEALTELKKDGGIRVMKMGDSDRVYRGDGVMALGFPLGCESLKSTTGTVSGREQIDGQYMIQVSAPINPGNSGGPSVNMCGEVVGINTSKPDYTQHAAIHSEGIGWIIPINEAKLFLGQLQNVPVRPDGRPKVLRKPFLGILFTHASPDLADFLHNPKSGGLYVVDTYKKHSLLAKAGVLEGDMIYEIDGYHIDEFGEISAPWSEDKVSVSAYVARLKLGDKVRLVLYRQGAKKVITFTLNDSDLLPIRFMYPGYEDLDYEVFGGMVVMPLALNHLPLLVQPSPEIARYTESRNQVEPALVITHIFPDSTIALNRTFGVGEILSEVNGKAVKTLEQFRDAVMHSKDTGVLTVKTHEKIFTVLQLSSLLEQEDRLQKTYFYQESALAQRLKKAVNYGQKAQKTT